MFLSSQEIKNSIMILTSKFDVLLVVQKQILGLDITMNNTILVAVENGSNYLPKCSSRFFFAHSFVRNEVIWNKKNKDLKTDAS